MNQWMNEWMNERNEWMNELMNEWMNEWNERMKWKKERMNESINEWMNEWMKWKNEMKEWMNEWMNEWTNEGMKEGRNEAHFTMRTPPHKSKAALHTLSFFDFYVKLRSRSSVLHTLPCQPDYVNPKLLRFRGCCGVHVFLLLTVYLYIDHALLLGRRHCQDGSLMIFSKVLTSIVFWGHQNIF